MPERITDTAIDRMPRPKTRKEIRDTVVRGLLLRLGVQGDRVWEVIVSRGGKRQRVRLGQYPTMKTKEARKAAEAAKEDARSPARGATVRTFADLFKLYKQAKATEMRSWRMIEGAWRNWAEPRLGHVRISDVTIHHGLDLRDHVTAEVSAIRGSQVIRYIRPVLSWAADERIIDANPWHGLKAKAVAQPRDRVLTQKEWLAVWEASFLEPFPMGELARALMLTACRLNSVAGMRWDEIQDTTWTIPRDRVKATKKERAGPHVVPLTPAMMDLLASMPRLGPCVFSMDGKKPIRPGSRQKERLAKRAEVKAWTYHDLRRSGATFMAQQGVPRFTIERVLGHTDATVTATYDKSLHLPEKREALEILAATLPDQTPDNIVRIGVTRPR